jgi:hypothetical protein
MVFNAMNKKSQIGIGTVVLVLFVIGLIFAGSGLIKFIFFTNLWPYIIGGFIVIFWLLTSPKK